MNRAMIATLVLLVFGGIMMAENAEAGWFDKSDQKDKDAQENWVPRYDNYPTMAFQKGILSRGLGHSWELDGMKLMMGAACQVTNEMGEEGALGEGREALVMGSRFGDTMIAHRVRILKPDSYNEGLAHSAQVIPSDVDPTVGEGSGPE